MSCHQITMVLYVLSIWEIELQTMQKTENVNRNTLFSKVINLLIIDVASYTYIAN